MCVLVCYKKHLSIDSTMCTNRCCAQFVALTDSSFYISFSSSLKFHLFSLSLNTFTIKAPKSREYRLSHATLSVHEQRNFFLFTNMWFLQPPERNKQSHRHHRLVLIFNHFIINFHRIYIGGKIAFENKNLIILYSSFFCLFVCSFIHTHRPHQKRWIESCHRHQEFMKSQ